MTRNSNRLDAAVAVAALAGGGAGAGAVALTHGSSAQPTKAAAAAPNVTNVASGTLSVGQIAKKAASVVEIDTTESSSNSPFPGAQGSTSALGTGFVYDS